MSADFRSTRRRAVPRGRYFRVSGLDSPRHSLTTSFEQGGSAVRARVHLKDAARGNVQDVRSEPTFSRLA